MVVRSVAAVRKILLWMGREGPGLKPLLFTEVFRRAKALRSHLRTRAGAFPVCRGTMEEQMRGIEFTKNTNNSYGRRYGWVSVSRLTEATKALMDVANCLRATSAGSVVSVVSARKRMGMGRVGS